MKRPSRGKIGRLPRAIQAQVNRRLENGGKRAAARPLAQCPAGGARHAGGGICRQAHSRAKFVRVAQVRLPAMVGATAGLGVGAGNDLHPRPTRDRPDGRVGERPLSTRLPQADGHQRRWQSGFANPAGLFARCGVRASGRPLRDPFAIGVGAPGRSMPGNQRAIMSNEHEP
jgi:hypothetical protein